VADGDSPTMRLEQNGSSGFTPQTWDVAGNETNFFIRDATNGSKLPFKIKPGAPTNSLFVAANGDIGLGTQSPAEKLHVESGNVFVKSGNVVVAAGKLGVGLPSPTVPLDVVGNVKIKGNALIDGFSVWKGNVNAFMTSNSTFYSATFAPIMHFDATNARVGIGTITPGHQLELSQDDAVKPNGGSWAGPSDRRLKTDIHSFTDGLEKVLKIQPVRYHYNGKLGLPSDKEFIGVIAQDMQKIAPYTIKKLNHPSQTEDYLAYDGSAVTYMLVNAVKEQQALIESQQREIAKLQGELSEVQTLKQAVAQLTQLVQGQQEFSTTTAELENENTTKAGRTGEK
jgi:Chaperone of endosialidase